jgi:spore germination protein YaaH
MFARETVVRLMVAFAATQALQLDVLSAAEKPMLIGWTANGDKGALASLKARAPQVRVVAPMWWTVRSDGSLRWPHDATYIVAARSAGFEVWPVLSNGQSSGTTILRNARRRGELIERVGAMASSAHAHGINVDWENVHASNHSTYVAFVKEAARAWHARGLVVSVDVAVGEFRQRGVLRGLAECVDWVVLMAYDEHRTFGTPGPTASLPWVERAVEEALAEVPAEKLILGVPFFAYDYSEEPGKRARVMTVAAGRGKMVGATAQWNERLGLTVATFVDSGYLHRVWIEDERSLRKKAEVARRAALGGMAAWRFGFDSPEAWRALVEGLSAR